MCECVTGLMSDWTRGGLDTWPACRSDAHTRQIMQACNKGGILTFTTWWKCRTAGKELFNYQKYGIHGAICRLEQYSSGNSFSFQGKEVSERIQHERKQPTSPIDIRKIQPLQNPALMDYLRSRNIPPEMAAHHVQEMYYRIGDKPYFALAFKNDAGGYELRNPRFKGSTSPKDITHIRQSGKKNDSCFVFEGVMDYLSFIAIRQKTNPTYPWLAWLHYPELDHKCR